MMSHSPDIWPGLTESSVIAPFYVIILMHNWVITKNFVPKQNKKMKKKTVFSTLFSNLKKLLKIFRTLQKTLILLF